MLIYKNISQIFLFLNSEHYIFRAGYIFSALKLFIILSNELLQL